MVERLRIIHCFRAPVGGLFRHVLDLSGEQAERGHDVGYVLDSTVSDPLTEQRLAKAATHLKLGVEVYDPDIYFNEVRSGPRGGYDTSAIDRIRSRWTQN